METEEFDFFSKGSFRIHARQWIPEGEVKAVLCIVHGLGEHIGRYEAMAQYFTERQIAVFGHDQRGHGKSEGKTGHASYENLLEDLQELIINARKEYNDQPIFLFGQDLGGNLIANYLLKLVSSEISGVIISAGWFQPVHKTKKALIIGSFWPSYTIDSHIDPESLTKDESASELYSRDPQVHSKISLQLYNSLSSSGKFAIYNAALIEIPVLVCHGDADELASMDTSRQFAEAIGTPAEFKLWKDAKHEPHQDKNKTSVWQYYCDWLLNHL